MKNVERWMAQGEVEMTLYGIKKGGSSNPALLKSEMAVAERLAKKMTKAELAAHLSDCGCLEGMTKAELVNRAVIKHVDSLGL